VILLSAVGVVVGGLADVQADGAPRNTGPDFGKAGPAGLLVIVLLLLATVFLIRSMNRQLKKVPDSFDRHNLGADQVADDGTPAVDGVGEPSDEVDEVIDTAVDKRQQAEGNHPRPGHGGSPHEPDNRASRPGDERG
jgi:hypothetical protein